MTYNSVSCNVHAPGTPLNNERTIKLAAGVADVLCLQEAQEDATRAVLASLPGFSGYHPTGLPAANPILWRTAKMVPFDEPGWTKIYKNSPLPDGPDRTMTWVPLLEKATGRKVIEINIHMVAKAYTTHPERQPGWMDSLVAIGVQCNKLLAKYPGVPLVLKADWNRHTSFDIPSVLEQEIKSLPTFGNRRYDRFFLVGKVQGSDPDNVATPSDHDSLKVSITLLPQEARKSIQEIAAEVLEGEWGNGEERMRRITAAGYEYNDVQAAVARLIVEAEKPTPKPIPKPVPAPKPDPKPAPKPRKPNRVMLFRAAVSAALKLSFPARKDRPDANNMRDDIAQALKNGPSS